MNPLTLWFLLIVVFVIVVGVFYKIIKALIKSVLYALVISLILIIVVLFFVNMDFQNFIKELDGPNLYLLTDVNSDVVLGYYENPFKTLSTSEISSIDLVGIANETNTLAKFKVNNIFVHSKESLQNKNLSNIIFFDEKLSKDIAINKVFDSSLSLTERTNLFASMVQSWDSKFFFRNLKSGNMMSYPARKLTKFVYYSPDLFLPLFGFDRSLEEK